MWTFLLSKEIVKLKSNNQSVLNLLISVHDKFFIIQILTFNLILPGLKNIYQMAAISSSGPSHPYGDEQRASYTFHFTHLASTDSVHTCVLTVIGLDPSYFPRTTS